MNTSPQLRPDSSEYFSYYDKYVQLVPEADVIGAMATQLDQTLQYLRQLPAADGDKRYAPGKWSVKEVVGHMIDTERVFMQRALFFSRGSHDPLPGYETDDWARAGSFDTVELEHLINEFEHVRQSTIWFFRNLTNDAWSRRGIGSNREFSVRALAFIIVGHERHHLHILQTRYA